MLEEKDMNNPPLNNNNNNNNNNKSLKTLSMPSGEGGYL